jgi:hypothetical protein
MSLMRSITNDNIDRFMELLRRSECDQDRSLYQRLLIAEADRFSEAEHRREAVDRCLITARELLQDHMKRGNEMRDRGINMTQADAQLNNLHALHSTLMLIRMSGTARPDTLSCLPHEPS